MDSAATAAEIASATPTWFDPQLRGATGADVAVPAYEVVVRSSR